MNGNQGGAPWGPPPGQGSWGGPPPGWGYPQPPYPPPYPYGPPPGWRPPPAPRPPRSRWIKILASLVPFGAAYLLFVPSRPDRVEDRTVTRLQWLRAGAGLIALIWVTMAYQLVSSAGEMAMDRGAQWLESFSFAVGALPLVIGGFILASRPPNRRMYLRRAVRPLVALLAIFASSFMFAVLVDVFKKFDQPIDRVPVSEALLMLGEAVALLWLMGFILVGAVLCSIHLFRVADVHELLPPILAATLVWVLAIADAVSDDYAGLPFGVRLLVLLCAPLTVSAISALEIRRLRAHHGITLRQALGREAPAGPGR